MVEKKVKAKVDAEAKKSSKVLGQKPITKELHKQTNVESEISTSDKKQPKQNSEIISETGTGLKSDKDQIKKKNVVQKPGLIKDSKKSEKKIIKGSSITIKQTASGAGRFKSQIQTLIGLGLNKINKESTLEDTPAIRGMLRKVAHLIQIIKN